MLRCLFKKGTQFILFSCVAFNVAAQSITDSSSKKGAVKKAVETTDKNQKLSIDELSKFNTIPKLSSSDLLIDKQIKDLHQQALQNTTSPAKTVVRLLENASFFKANAIKVSLEHTIFRDSSGLTSRTFNQFSAVTNYDILTDFTVFGIPFNFTWEGTNGFYNHLPTDLGKFYKVNFDPKKYKDQLQKQVMDRIKPEVVAASVQQRLNNIRAAFQSSLLTEVKVIQSQLTSEVKSGVNLPDNFSALDFNDASELRSRLFKEYSQEKYAASLSRYQELMKTKGDQNSNSDVVLQETVSDIKKYEALEKIYQKILSSKKRFDDNKLVQELKSTLPFTPGNFKEYLTKPGNLEQVVKEHASLKGIQSLFMNLTKLDIGQNPLQAGELNLQNVMNTGVNTQFKTNKTSLGFIQGSNNNNDNRWLQGGLANTVTNQYTNLSGFSIGNGTQSSNDQSLSINFFNFRNATQALNQEDFLQASYLSSLPRRDAVITWHSGFKLSGKNEVKLDVSKSFGSYQNLVTKEDKQIPANAFTSVHKEDGLSSFAATINYTGEIAETPIQINVKKVGLGYNNPGNMFLRRGETELGFGISRKLFNQKLTVKYYSDYKTQTLDPAKNYTYVTLSNKINFNYKIKKNNRVGIMYQHNNYASRINGQPTVGGLNERLQADGSYQFYLTNKKIMNQVVVSSQRLRLPVFSGEVYTNKSFLLTHTSSLMLKRNLLTATFMTNHSSSTEYYFNTGFTNVELGHSYPFSDKLTVSSTAGYYSNKGWNKQLGLSQQISMIVIKKLSIDVGVNYKRAIKMYRPELANQFFLTSSLHFQF